MSAWSWADYEKDHGLPPRKLKPPIRQIQSNGVKAKQAIAEITEPVAQDTMMQKTAYQRNLIRRLAVATQIDIGTDDASIDRIERWLLLAFDTGARAAFNNEIERPA